MQHARHAATAVLALVLAVSFAAPAHAQQGDRPTETMEKQVQGVLDETGASVVAVWTNRGRNPGAERGYGSGFSIGNELFLTAHSAVPRNANWVKIQGRTGREYDAEVVARAESNDCVLLRAEGSDIPPVTFGDSDAVQVGDVALTLGNSYGSLDRVNQVSVSVGVVSSLYRTGDAGRYKGDAIETDAAVNAGNFGGPLTDLDGRVIGLVTRSYSYNRWLGTAVPINQVKLVLDRLKEGRDVTGGWVGIQTFGDEVNDDGIPVLKVHPDTPAEQAGLQEGDRIVALDGRPAVSSQDVADLVRSLPPGTRVQVRVAREGNERTLTLTLGLPPIPTTTLEHRVLGVEAEDVEGGARITEVIADGPAARITTPWGDTASLKTGDVILKIGDTPVESVRELRAALEDVKPGSKVKITVSRDGTTSTVTAEAGE